MVYRHPPPIPSGYSQDFLFILVFCSLIMLCLGMFFWYLSCFAFHELPGSVVFVINLAKFSEIITSNISSVQFFFFSFWYSNYIYILSFQVVPQSWMSWSFFFLFFFSVHFSFRSFYVLIITDIMKDWDFILRYLAATNT